jgi:hypothetical protein
LAQSNKPRTGAKATNNRDDNGAKSMNERTIGALFLLAIAGMTVGIIEIARSRATAPIAPAESFQAKQPAAATTPAAPTPAATATTTAPESTEAERWAVQVVYAKKCPAELPPTFVLGSVLKLESFPSDVAPHKRLLSRAKFMVLRFRHPDPPCCPRVLG